jgi:uncharacterized Tic20 family protein
VKAGRPSSRFSAATSRIAPAIVAQCDGGNGRRRVHGHAGLSRTAEAGENRHVVATGAAMAAIRNQGTTWKPVIATPAANRWPPMPPFARPAARPPGSTAGAAIGTTGAGSDAARAAGHRLGEGGRCRRTRRRCAACELSAPALVALGLVFLFGVLTLGLFSVVWYFVQTTWVKIDPRSRATLYMGLSVACYALYVAMYLVASVGMALSGHGSTGAVGVGLVLMIGSLLPMLAYVVLYYCAYYSMSGSLQRVLPAEYGVRPEIGGVTLFFLGVLPAGPVELAGALEGQRPHRTAAAEGHLLGAVGHGHRAGAGGRRGHRHVGGTARQRHRAGGAGFHDAGRCRHRRRHGRCASAGGRTYLQPTVEQDDADPAGADAPDDAPTTRTRRTSWTTASGGSDARWRRAQAPPVSGGRQAEKGLGRCTGGGGDAGHGIAPVARDFLGDVRQERRLVASVLRHRLERARQQIGRVGLDHQPIGGDVLHQLAQVRAAPLVAQPAGDADVPVAIQTVEQLFACR